MANARYTLCIDRVFLKTGELDSNGLLNVSIPPNAQEGVVSLGSGIEQKYSLSLGTLDPLDSISGIQGRLNDLGFNCGQTDGVIGPKTEAAICAFQEKYQLKVDGIVGPDTKRKLGEVYGR